METRVHRENRSDGAISVTVSPNQEWELEEIRVHLDANGAATDLTVTMDSGINSNHDTVLYTKAMSGVTDLVYSWETPKRMLHKNDKVVIAYANGDDAAWGVEVYYSLL